MARRMHGVPTAVIVAAGVLMAPPAALAQSAMPPASAQPQPQPPAPQPSAPQAAAAQPAAPSSIWEQDTLTGDWGGLRKNLSDAGVTIGLQEQSEVWNNLTGGRRQGATYDGVTTASVQLDLGKLAGWSGATFFVNGYQIHGHGPSGSLVGNLQDVSSVEAADSTKLYDLWLEQSMLNGKLSVRLGQEGVSDEFMLADDAAVFLNSSFGYPAVAETDLPSGGPTYPLASVFVRVKYHPNDAITVLGGVYNDDPAPPGTGDPQLLDRNGTAFRLTGHALAIAELWYARNQGDNAAGLPATYKVGAWFDSARFADQLYDDRGLLLASPASDGMPLQHEHDYAVYGIADQMVWRRAGTTDQGIALFLEVMGAPDDRNLSNLSVTAGIHWKAPFAGRDNDIAGLAVAYEGIGAAARQYSDELAAFTGTGTRYNATETVVEATYQYQVAPWLALQPDAQYVINPGAGILASATGKPLKSAFVAGVRATITF